MEQVEQQKKVVVGIDEAGRGAFFSRIYSAVVVSNPDLTEDIEKNKIIIRDSKKMTPRQRNLTFDFLVENIMFGVGYCDEKEIDHLGITKCNILSMHRALDNLVSKYPQIEVEKILVDGVLFSPWQDGVPFELIVKGESKHLEIAMASILAKTCRDRFIVELCENFPELDERYDIKNNKGYGTAKHIQGLRKYGKHEFHRQSFIRHYCKGLQFLV